VFRILGVAGPDVGDPDASGEADPAVDHDQPAGIRLFSLSKLYQTGGRNQAKLTPSSSSASTVLRSSLAEP